MRIRPDRIFGNHRIILVILGLAAIAIPSIATLAVEILVGWLFLISGIAGWITTFWMGRVPGFWWSLVSAILGIAAGIMLLLRPLSGVLSLTLVLIVFFVIEGVASMMFALEHKCELSGRWGWMLASGIIVPIAFGERLYSAIRAPKRFVRFADGEHEGPSTSTARFLRCATSWLPPPPTSIDRHHEMACGAWFALGRKRHGPAVDRETRKPLRDQCLCKRQGMHRTALQPLPGG
ncbi:MAG: HdeD family acid-resistance protein [Rhodoplanes sp.]